MLQLGFRFFLFSLCNDEFLFDLVDLLLAVRLNKGDSFIKLCLHFAQSSLIAVGVTCLDLIYKAQHATVAGKCFSRALGAATQTNYLRLHAMFRHVGQHRFNTFIKLTVPTVVDAWDLLN